MEDHHLDFHSVFRTLCYFNPDSSSDELIRQILSTTADPTLNQEIATKAWQDWLVKYGDRIRAEKDQWGSDMATEQQQAALGANPRFVLRQWVLEDVIAKVEKDTDTGKRVLAKVLHVSFIRRDMPYLSG